MKVNRFNNKNFNISIGISAYNEEANIERLLRSILDQDKSNFTLKEILVVLDGCTDQTLKNTQKIDDSRIKVINDGLRKGKSTRINEMCHLFQGDALILLDADIFVKDNYLLSEITNKFTTGSNPGLICVSAIPLDPQNLIEKAINSSVQLYTEYANLVNEGRNIFTCKGVLLAISEKYAHTVNIPENIFAYDTYLYLDSYLKGFNYNYTNKTSVYYKLPSTLKDHIRQDARFHAAYTNVESIFGTKNLKVFERDEKLFRKLLIHHTIKDPFYSFCIFFINRISRLYCIYKKGKFTQKWMRISSTKNVYDNL